MVQGSQETPKTGTATKLPPRVWGSLPYMLGCGTSGGQGGEMEGIIEYCRMLVLVVSKPLRFLLPTG
jgi:hypothetical protein